MTPHVDVTRPGPARVLGRLLVLPVRVVRTTAVVAFRSGVQVGSLSARATAAVSRRLGVVGTVCLVAGMAIGLLVAPVSGRQLRSRIRTLLAGSRPVGDDDLQATVVAALASTQRTWHLPQPAVSVAGGVVTLSGTAPHETARIELEAAAAGVAGVQGVVNQLTVA
jgi:osmotically-inducible protein OsmY